MAQQTLLWTVLPAGKRDGRWAVSIVVSPRLVPQTVAEARLGHAAWRDWADWPATLAQQAFQLEIGGASVGLRVVTAPALAPSTAVWQQLFFPALSVAPFKMLDVSQVNLRSYPLRPLLGFIRKHYQRLSAEAGGSEHPLLLPWRNADPLLKGMLGELGTRTVTQEHAGGSLERMAPGFARFHAEDRSGRRVHDRAVDSRVFNPQSRIKAPVRRPGRDEKLATFPLRALPPDWEDPALIRNGTIQVAPADREARAQLMEQFSGPAEYALWQADRFYHRVQPTAAQKAMRVPSYAGIAAAPEAPEFDFHQRIASYGDHPNLLRRLGLVIDCVLERNTALDALIAAGNGNAEGFMKLRITASGTRATAPDQFPSSAFRVRGGRFHMAARTPDHGGGMLRLQGANDRGNPASKFDVYQLDPDGTALKTGGFLLSAQNLVGRSLELGGDGGVTYTTGDRQPVTSLRSGGIGVSRHGRAGVVGMHAATAALNDQAIRTGGVKAAQVTLFAEDVLRGYRVDVRWRDRWHSLVQREGRYEALPRDGAPALPLGLPPDEGHVKGASTSSNDAGSADHYLHETLFRWTGWSLAAPRPGRHLRSRLVPGTQLQQEEVVDEADEAAPKGNGLSVQVQARRGTLPRLRFGHRYALRARLVDLAGNSLALEGDSAPADDEQSTEPLRYGRFEPVEPPALVLRRRLSEGESPERLVLRSDFDKNTGAYASSSQGGDLHAFYNHPDFDYGAVAERHLVPPKAAQQLCELHGMFDDAIGSTDPDAIKKAYAIAARESGSLMHPMPGAQIELVTPQRAEAVATVQGQLPKPPEQADDRVDRLSAGQYLIHREAQVPVPYLPDPACGGVSLYGVPGLVEWMKGKPIVELAPGFLGCVLDKGARAGFFAQKKDRFYLLLDVDADPGDDPGKRLEFDWPKDVRSLRIVADELPGEMAPPPCGAEFSKFVAPKWDFDKAELRVFVPKGFVVRMRYASFVHDRLVGQFALPAWQDDAAGRVRLAVEGMVGCNWMLTPWRPLTLVHATQHPVCPPRAVVPSVQRNVGWQHVDLLAREVWLHGPSTGHFEIVAEWQEWVDEPMNDTPAAPGPKRVTQHAVLTPIRLGENHPNVFRLVDAVAAQTEFKSSGGQTPPQIAAQRPAVPGNRHEFGDTKFRFVRYRLRATTRFREYLPPTLYADTERITRDGPVWETERMSIEPFDGLAADTDPGAPVRISPQGANAGTLVRASSPPDVPEVVYLVPTFRWNRPTARQSTRLGNGVRVYLERSWFSSGDGELLGVVIQGAGQSVEVTDAARLPFVSQWGADPLWDGTLPNLISDLTDFTAKVVSENVTLLELPQTPVHVVGHRVQFDATRRLWFADIEINPGSAYMPFVRLALVRYQPNALAGCKVSRVVLTDFAQLLPRRHARVTLGAGGVGEAAVFGPAPRRGPMRQVNSGGGTELGLVGATTAVLSGEDGRNRMELVLQQQPAGLATDLGWTDVRVLATARVGGDAATRDAAQRELPADVLLQQAAEQANVRTRGGQTLRFDRIEELAGTAILRPELGSGLVFAPDLNEPDIWRRSFTLGNLVVGRRHRLMLREFERYYTDRTVPVPGATDQRRRLVVEERLVFVEVFVL